MKFEDALYAMRQGAVISRPGRRRWGLLAFESSAGHETEDILAEDWYIVPNMPWVKSELRRFPRHADGTPMDDDLAEGVPVRKVDITCFDNVPGFREAHQSLLEDTLGDLREHVDTLAEGFCARHDDTEENVLDLGRDVDELDRDVDGLRERVSSLEERHARVARRVNELEDEDDTTGSPPPQQPGAELESLIKRVLRGETAARFRIVDRLIDALRYRAIRLEQRMATQEQRTPQVVYLNDGPRLVPCDSTANPTRDGVQVTCGPVEVVSPSK